MSPLQLIYTVWRRKLAVLPAVLITVFGLVYVTVLTPPTYEVTVSYVLVPPPGAPTPEDVARDPSLADVRADNPFLRFQSSSIVVDLLARQTNSAGNREVLLAAGADERFEVVPSSRYGFASPIVDIIAIGSSTESAMSTAQLVSASVEEQLRALQADQQVDEPYMYKPLLVDFPAEPRLRVSNKLRAVVAVVVAGSILTLTAASIAEALAARPITRRKIAPVHLAPSDGSTVRDISDHEEAPARAMTSRRTT